AAGPHTITFLGLDPGGGNSTAFVDNVQLTTPTPPPAPPPAALADAGFESPVVGSGFFGAFQYDPAGTPLAFVGHAGVAGNATGVPPATPTAPEGAQAGSPQPTGSFSQTRNLAAGSYQLSFQAAQRGNFPPAGTQTFRVLVDGQAVGTFTPGSTAYAAFTTD